MKDAAIFQNTRNQTGDAARFDPVGKSGADRSILDAFAARHLQRRAVQTCALPKDGDKSVAVTGIMDDPNLGASALNPGKAL